MGNAKGNRKIKVFCPTAARQLPGRSGQGLV